MEQELQYLSTLLFLMQTDLCAFVIYFYACANTLLS